MSNKVSQILVLTVLNGSRRGEIIPVLQNQILIGRFEDGEEGAVDIRFKDESISQTHAEFKWVVKTKQWGVKDKKSSNGTACNDEIVKSSKFTYVNSGDVVTFGDISVLILNFEEINPNIKIVELYDLIRDGLKQYAYNALQNQKIMLRSEVKEFAEKCGQPQL